MDNWKPTTEPPYRCGWCGCPLDTKWQKIDRSTLPEKWWLQKILKVYGEGCCSEKFKQIYLETRG
jgi:hypothetical protein